MHFSGPGVPRRPGTRRHAQNGAEASARCAGAAGISRQIAMHRQPPSGLEAVLAAPALAARAMDLHSFEGLACALVLGPRVISPAVWLGWVWDREEGWRAPEFADLEQANATMGALMRAYNEIAQALGPAAAEDAAFVPSFRGAGAQAVASFCAGVLRGIELAPDDWAPLEAEHPQWLERLRRADASAAEIEALLPALRHYWRGRSDRLQPLQAGGLREELRAAFEFFQRPFPGAAVALAHRQRETVAPWLLQVLEDVARDPEPARDGDYTFHHFAMVLLACWRDTRAWRPLLAWARLPFEVLDDMLGDALHETYGRALASVCDGDLAPLVETVRAESVSPWVRMALLEAWQIRVVEGDAALAPLEDLLLELGARDAERLAARPREPHAIEMIDDIAGLACDVGSHRLAARVREWFDAGLIDERTIDRAFFEQEFARTHGQRLQMLRSHRRGYITDVEAEFRWWAGYSEAEEGDGSDADDADFGEVIGPQREHPAPTTIVRDAPKIGRNDPCPCGSGRKYKKCHGAH